MRMFQFFALLLGVILLLGAIPAQSFADVVSPRQQMKLDFSPEQIICSEELVKITRESTGSVACVKPATAKKLSENGWAQGLSSKQLDEIKEKERLEKKNPSGTITKVAVVKQLVKNVKAGTSTGISGYSYIFDVCSKSNAIRAPEIFVTSDSETKRVKLGSMLKENTCYTSSVIIKAADPTSISAELLNKGGVSDRIESLEAKIDDLKNRIAAAKQKIPISEEEGEPKPENLNNIASMKKELKGLQDQIRRYLMALYVPPSVKATEIQIPKSITGKPLEGMTASLVSVTESIVKPESEDPDMKRFNVVFEACSGKETVRLPIITIDSD